MKVMVALDGSPASDQALNEVLSRNWAPGTQVRLVHVAGNAQPKMVSSIFQSFGFHPPDNASADKVKETMVKIADDLSGRYVDVLFRSEVLKGDPVDTIMSFADAYHPDLMVVGTNNKSTMDALLLGSVSRTILDKASFPVLVARQSQMPPDSTKKRVLVAIDDSPPSAAGVEWLMEQSWLAGNDVCLLAVIEPLSSSSSSNIRKEATRQLSWKAEKALLDRLLLKWAEILRARLSLTTVYSGVVDGQPADTIIKAAKNWPADLIVMGSHGKSAIAKLILGSVSQKVSTDAHCSVEVVKGRESALFGQVLASVQSKEDFSEMLKDNKATQSGPHIMPPMGF